MRAGRLCIAAESAAGAGCATDPWGGPEGREKFTEELLPVLCIAAEATLELAMELERAGELERGG